MRPARASIRFILTLALLTFMAAPAHAGKDGEIFGEGDNANRTVNRSPIGQIFYPDWLVNKPEHYEFLPLVSNHDPQNQHPQQWQGQDWDIEVLKQHGWTPEQVIAGFYANKTFKTRYMRSPQMPVLVVGPNFYKISDLDRRRSLKLLTDHEKVFESGIEMVELRDWHTDNVIGSYTRKGLFLN